MEKTIITISREFCAGGTTVGRLVADMLGVPFYDKKLVEKIAEESGFAAAFIEEHGEHSPGKTFFSYAFAPQSGSGMIQNISTEDQLWNAQCNTILSLAEQGPCVIVGRNADYILKDFPNVLNVFLTADTAFKTKHLLELYGPSKKAPEVRMAEKDKRRRVNYQHYTGRVWGQAQNYDLCLNTGLLGFDQAAKIIVSIVKNSK